jgi:hypothetical protein
MQTTLINILGAGRSGTTMLDLMLGNDNESFSMGEVRAWFRPFREHHFAIDCNCGNPSCEYWLALKGVDESKFYTHAFTKWNVKYIIDSSKNLSWMIDGHSWAKKQNIEVINFIIHKPIIDYIFSIWKRGESVDDALYRYKLYYKRFFESGINAYAVNFDELVNNTDTMLDVITDITKQPKVENRHQFWVKEHHHLFGSGGTRNQAKEGESKIKTKESFPEEFVKQIPDIKNRIERDKQLSRILLKLEQIDVKEKNRQPNHAIRKPLWYYYLKIHNRFKTRFPSSSKTKF